MSISNNFKDYQDEIDLALSQNACVEIELYSIIACIIREGSNGSKISLRDVSSRRISGISKKYYGDSGFPDFVVLERKKYNANILGCIEIKMPKRMLEDNSIQIKGHLNYFHKVIYTNGLVWKYYNNKINEWTCTLGEYKNSVITWEKDEKKWNELLKNLDSIIWNK